MAITNRAAAAYHPIDVACYLNLNSVADRLMVLGYSAAVVQSETKSSENRRSVTSPGARPQALN